MALRESDIHIVSPTSPATREDARAKARFDSSMVIICDEVKYADREAAEYFFRRMLAQCKGMASRYGFKGVA